MNKTGTKSAKPGAGSAQTSGGKRSIKDVHKDLGFAPLEEANISGYDDLDIDHALKAELKDNQLAYRFINFKTFKRNGFHKQHWKPYRRSSRPDNNVLFNLDADGYTVRGDLVLAVKPYEWNDARKQELAKKNALKSGIVGAKTKEMRELAAKSGIGAVVETDD